MVSLTFRSCLDVQRRPATSKMAVVFFFFSKRSLSLFVWTIDPSARISEALLEWRCKNQPAGSSRASWRWQSIQVVGQRHAPPGCTVCGISRLCMSAAVCTSHLPIKGAIPSSRELANAGSLFFFI